MTSEGIPFVAAAGILLIALALSAVMTSSTIIWDVALFEALLLLFIVYFFRDPDRTIPEGSGLIIAAADGKVVEIKEVTHPEISETPLIQVSVFLSIFDVHVNRVPVSGEVKTVSYQPGRFLMAWKEKASEENEQTFISIDSNGERIYLKQIAGLIARRISCRLSEGQKVVRGERFGMIRFGSRVDLLLPIKTEIRVQKGDKVTAGETVVGVMLHAS